MPRTGICTDVTCSKESTELYECHCCSWLICLKHLLEHVEISERDKQIKLNTIRNELVSSSYTLELLVEKKVNEIEREKQLVNQAKAILEKSNWTMEEIQTVSEEINQAIVSNQKEETIVKVEPSLTDGKASAYNNDKPTFLDLCTFTSSSSNHILQRSPSPVYVSVRGQIGTSSTPKNSILPTTANAMFSINSSNDENMDPKMNVSSPDDEGSRTERRSFARPCPLTFDGVFGLTKEQHFLNLCPVDSIIRGNLVGHFTMKHKIKKIYARRLYHAVQKYEDPNTKLFVNGEDVIDRDRHIVCPFSNKMIHLIEVCPTQSRKVPCQLKLIQSLYLVHHLVKYHSLPTHMAREVAKNYREKLSAADYSNGDHTLVD